MRLTDVAVLAAVFVAVLPATAHAYLDPGTGSQLFQVILAVFVGGVFSIKVFWHRIVDYFRSLGSGSDE